MPALNIEYVLLRNNRVYSMYSNVARRVVVSRAPSLLRFATHRCEAQGRRGCVCVEYEESD